MRKAVKTSPSVSSNSHPKTHKRIAALGLSALMVVSSVVGMSAPANAASGINDPATYLNENFNKVGFAPLTAGVDESVLILGSDTAASLNDRRVVFSLEDGRVKLRAYKPIRIDGTFGRWDLDPKADDMPELDYGLDPTFGASGTLDLGVENVVSVAMSSLREVRSTTEYRFQPWLVVNTNTGGTIANILFKLSSLSLATCDSSTPCTVPTGINLTTEVNTLAGGAGALVSGFSHGAGSQDISTSYYISGASVGVGANADRPFFGEISSSTNEIVSGRGFTFSSLAFDAVTNVDGYLETGKEGYDKFIPARNGLQVRTPPNKPAMVFLAGSLENGDGERIAVIYRRLVTTGFPPITSGPQLVFDLGHDTRINTMFGYTAFGGSYVKEDGDDPQPLLVAGDIEDGSQYVAIELSSTGPGELLEVGHNNYANQNIRSQRITAAASDGDMLRVYTWVLGIGSSSVMQPTDTATIEFPGVVGAVKSAAVTPVKDTSTSHGMVTFASYSDGTTGTLLASYFQPYRLFPRLSANVNLSFDSGLIKFLVPPAPLNQISGVTPTYTYFSSTNSFTSSGPDVNVTADPADLGLTEITSGFAEFQNRSLTPSEAGLSVGQHVVLRFSFAYSGEVFNYYTSSIQVTSDMVPESSEEETDNSQDNNQQTEATLTSPSVNSVIPVRGGAQVYFSRGSNEPGTTYTVTATDGNTEITGSGTISPITVGGLQDGTSYTFRITATGPDGTPASPGTASSPAAPLAPGGADAFFFGSIEQGPIPSIGIDENADARPQPSGNIYFVSADVRRILPSGQEDTDNFGTGGVVVPDGITGIVKDVVEVTPQGETEPELYFLVDDGGTLKVVKTDSKGENPVTETPSLTPPSNPLQPRLVVTGGVVTAEIPGVDLPSTPLATNFALAAGSPAPAGSPLAGGTVVVGIADGDLVIAVTSTDNSTTTVPITFNGGNPVVIDNTSGTTEVAGVAVDDDGNIYVSARINGATVVLAYNSTGEVLTDFATGGTFTFATQTIPGSIRITDGRVVVSASTTSATTLQALVTPGGLSAMPLAVSSTLAPAAGPAAAPFAGPILSGVAAGGIPAVAGGNVSISGQQLGSVSAAKIGGLDAEVVSATDTGLVLKLPAGLAAGVYDLVLTSAQGVVTIQGAIRVEASSTAANRGEGQWTKAERNAEGVVESVRMYAKDPVNAGKIQFKLNGKEIAWVRAVDASDPKLRTRSNGESYLVRTVTLLPGKNALEIFVDGVRVWRAAYTLR